jgi:hypothetical protein
VQFRQTLYKQVFHDMQMQSVRKDEEINRGSDSMPEYEVRLAALAIVEQRQLVTAASPEEAAKVAKSRARQKPWVYQELSDEPPDVQEVKQVGG